MILQHYLELLVQYRRLVVAGTLAAAVGAGALAWVFLVHLPVYIATASVTILPSEAELSFSRRFLRDGSGRGDNPADVMMQTHVEYLLSRRVAELTLERLEHEAPPEEAEAEAEAEPGLLRGLAGQAVASLRAAYKAINTGTAAEADPHEKAVNGIRKALDVALVENSYIMQIAAHAATPQAAATIANTVAEAYVQRVRELQEGSAAALIAELKAELAKRQVQLDPQGATNLRSQLIELELAGEATIEQVRVIDPAVPPLHPASPKVVPAGVAGGTIGFLSCILLIIVLDTFGSTARTSMDMTRVVGSRFLGRVPPALSGPWAGTDRRLPLRGAASFAAAAGARMGLIEGRRDIWIRVAGIDDPLTAQKAAVGIAAACTTSGLPVELLLDQQRRFAVRRDRRALEFKALAQDEPFVGGAVITASPFLQPPLRRLTSGGDATATARAPETVAPAEPDLPRELVVVAVAVGKVHEDLLATLARNGEKRMFVLVP